MISGPADVPASQDRLTGFRQAMARHGHAYVPSVDGNFTHDSGETAMQQLLAEHPELDGVFVANDLMAQGALMALRDAGRRVPDDVAVIGFDDSSAALAARPPLTTVRHPLEDMAAERELLLARIDDPAAPGLGHLRADPGGPRLRLTIGPHDDLGRAGRCLYRRPWMVPKPLRDEGGCACVRAGNPRRGPVGLTNRG